MAVVNIHAAKTNLSRLLERVRAGEEIIIAKRGKHIARLCPLDPPKMRIPGLLKGQIDETFFDPLPDEEIKAWE